MEPNPPPHPAAGRSQAPTPRLLELRITIMKIEPPIWRLVRVPDTYTLHQLHRVIQLLFGWLDYHLYSFNVGERRFEAPYDDAEDEDSTEFRLSDLALGRGAAFWYTYDFGDEWVHEIVVENAHDAMPRDEDDPLPVLLAGERAGPPEDAGGPWGYGDMVKALRDRSHREHKRWRKWAGDYDPELFDLWMARNNLILAAGWGAI